MMDMISSDSSLVSPNLDDYFDFEDSSRIHNKKDSPTPNNVRSMAFSLHAFLHLADLFQTFF